MTDLGNERPLVTFALFAYNQEQYIREAVEGAFSQTYEPLEIILSDDCSSDNTYEIIQEMAAMYDGSHQLKVRRNEVNMGLASHVNVVMQSSRGDIIVVAAGDDISLPDRTSISVECFKMDENATAVLLSSDVINNSGKIVGERINRKGNEVECIQIIDDLLVWRHVTFGATRAVKREMFSLFGPLNDSCPTEDTPLLLRSLLSGTNIVSQHKAILYRRHDSNLSGADSLNRMNTDEIYKQYQDDIRTAVNLNLISDELKEKLCSWISMDHKIRHVTLKMSSNQLLSLRETIFAIQHPSTVLSQKIRFLIFYLSSSRWGSK